MDGIQKLEKRKKERKWNRIKCRVRNSVPLSFHFYFHPIPRLSSPTVFLIRRANCTLTGSK